MEFIPDKKPKLEFIPDAPDESIYQKYVPDLVKNTVGIVESGARMIPNMVSGTLGQAAGTIGGLATGDTIDQATQRGQDWAHAVSIPPATKQGAQADEMAAFGIDYIKQGLSDINAAGETYDPNAPEGSPRANPRLEAVNRFNIEAPFDILMARLGLEGGRAGLVGARDIIKNRRLEAENAAKRAEAFKELDKKAGDVGYEEALKTFDNEYIKYPQDYPVQAPQYGLGKKTKSLQERQAEYEADLTKLYEEQKAVAKQQAETAGRPLPSTYYVDRAGAAMGELPPRQFPEAADALAQRERTTTAADPSIVERRAQAFYRAAEEALAKGDKDKYFEYSEKADALHSQADQLKAGVNLPKPDTFQKGLEITQRGGPAETWNMGEGTIPSWTTEGGVKSVRPRDVTDVPIDPLQRATAIDILSDPKFRRDVAKLDDLDQRITAKTKEYDDPVVQRGLAMSESLGVNKAKSIGAELERLHRQRIQTQARVLAATDWANEMANRRAAKVEKTAGWDGPQQTIKVSFWDRLSSGISKTLDVLRGPGETRARGLGPIGRQRGAVNTDLLTLGIPHLIKTIGESETLKKFVGTYKFDTLKRDIITHFETLNVNNLGSGRYDNPRLGWINPSTFHDLAFKRDKWFYEDRSAGGGEWKRENIREALGKEHGLDDIPFLTVAAPLIEDGKLVLQIAGHEGRHRMDVFKEHGLEQVPVRWNADRKTTRIIDEAVSKGTEILLKSEDSTTIAKFPGYMNLDPVAFKKRQPVSQAGMADTKLVQNITTLGIASLVEAGLKKAAKAREGVEKRKLDQPKDGGKGEQSPQGVLDAATGENRTLKEWKETNDPSKVKDVDGIVTEGVGKWVNGNFLNQFAGNHPLVRYIVDKINNNLRMAHLDAKLTKDGTVGSKPTENSPTAVLKALTRSDKALLNEIADRYAGRYELSGEEIRTLGGSERVVNAYKVLRKAFDDMLEKVNAVRTEPINKLPGYFSRIREGDFKLDIIDPKTGEKVWSDMFTNRLDRALTMRGLKEKFGEEYTYESSMIDKESRGNPYNTSTIPFEELMATIKKSDPRRAIIESAARDIKAKRGFGRHSIYRKNIPGKEFDVEKGFNQFTDSAFQYIANMQNKAFVGDLMRDPDINAPKIKSWAQTYSDLSSGGYKSGEVIDAISNFGEGLWQVGTLGFSGPSGLRAAIRGANNIFMAKVLFFWRPIFAGVQAAQPFQFIPQHLAHMKAQGFKAGMLSAMYKGEKSLIEMGLGKADPEITSFIKDYQIPRGNIDPTMIQAMDLFGHHGGKFKDWAIGTAPLKAIEALGRLQASTIAYHFFKDAGLKGKELHMEAENFVNRVMVDYSKQEKPAIIGKTGILGTMFGPLSTFATNFWTSTAMFMKDITNNPLKPGSYSPMAIHIAQTALWGGLTGMLGVDLVDTVIKILRHPLIGAISPKTPTASERIMTNTDIPDVKILGMGTRDAAQFGMPSAALKMNVGGSFSAPELNMPSANTVPGVALVGQLAADMLPIITGRGTKIDRQRALKDIIPNSLAGALDVYDFDPANPTEGRARQMGETIPDLNHRGKGNIRMDKNEQIARLYGTHTLDTAREMAAVRDIKEKEGGINTTKGQLIDRAVDSLTAGGEHDIGDLMQQAVELGMTPKQFMGNVKQAIKDQEMTKAERMVGTKPNTLNRLQKYEELQQYNR